ncbi:AI-2E family transporter [Thermococci archaeon]|uniref:AI-2E family transporter n=1 Tax=Palaeococcus sp. (in: euryarchaeotes) TaxID=2820298 RepID=UPI000F1BBA42|nr:AI-2E family transporter [Palaeococcus sp. (in: euryarchaeotes)]MCD6558796.1 AI-2E family transporter [Palaeococcus sp. (in: euryarchaeotes)]RLF75543.1 MAG: AI-2E family transporter [Thermococci archaeon]RLF87706.1 MAG: AI-2E family transporter [Thermococci archaeon]
MRRSNIILWVALASIIIYLGWKMLQPMFSAVFFGAIAAYAFLPLHRRFSERMGEFWSSMVLTIILLLIALGTAVLLVLTLSSVLSSAYSYTMLTFDWVYTLPLPPGVEETIRDIQNQLLPYLREYILNYTLSLPKYLLQTLIFLIVFQYLLANSSEVSKAIPTFFPRENEELVQSLIEGTDKTLQALIRSWLLLNIAKGIFMALGFLIFGIAELGEAITAGIFTILFSFVPLFEGWMIWLIGSIYLIKQGFVFRGLLLAIYGFSLVSPLPDYTIRPRIVAKDARLDSTMVLLGMIGGAMAFGVKGLIAGPIVFNLVATLIREWKKMNTKEL